MEETLTLLCQPFPLYLSSKAILVYANITKQHGVVMTQIFNCFMIGEDNLLIQCADILLAKGHKINGIISSNVTVKQLAEERQITHYETLTEATLALKKTTFDYFFSILNETILSQEILSLPKQGCINLHDSLLPRYAGMNAVPWAILQAETTHGVTWHIMEQDIDTGDILSQQAFSISPQETSLSLYIKCYEYAIFTFKKLIINLENNTLQTQQQILSQRTYYTISEKPKGDGFIYWNSSAQEIERLFRATFFGKVQNRFCLMKWLLNDTVVVPMKLYLSDVISEALPGTIKAITDKQIQIATQTYDIIIEAVNTLEGIPYPISTLILQQKLRVGQILPSTTTKLKNLLMRLPYSAYSLEKKWLTELKKIEPSLYVFSEKEISAHPVKTYDKFTIALPVTKKDDFIEITLSLLLITFYRINNYTNQTFSLALPHLLPDDPGLLPFYAEFVPFTYTLEPVDTLHTILENVKQFVAFAKTAKSFKKDMFQRYPFLNARAFYQTIAIIFREEDLIPSTLQHPLSIFVNVSFSQITLILSLDDENHPLALQAKYLSSIFPNVLNQTLNDTNLSLQSITFLNKSILEKQLSIWNKTQQDFSQALFFLDKIKQHVVNTPQKTALIFNATQLTYQSLFHQVSQLAYKIKICCGKNDRCHVAFCLDHGIEMVVAILAIIEAGGLYIPLDPSHPKKHQEYILEHGKPDLFICTEKTDDVDISNKIKKLYLLQNGKISEQTTNQADFDPIIETHPRTHQDVGIQHNALAYIIYTSGSTGTPKGVEISHLALHNFLCDMEKRLNLTEQDRWLAITTPTFDIANLELLLPLMVGATLVIAKPEISSNPHQLADILVQKQITVMQATPTIWQLLEDIAWQGRAQLTGLCGGDLLTPELAQSLVKKLHTLWHLYGPTETTIWSTCERYTKNLNLPLSIGKPIANTEAYILDKTMMPLPPGAIGMLYIAGLGLANSYHQCKTLTEKKFIVNPFYPDISCYERLYKTGDLAYWLHDGRLMFVGRKDFQVKLHGYRIELQAIEHYLHTFPGIKTAIAHIHVDKQNEKKLIAYILPDHDKVTLSFNALKTYLSSYLPLYMIPSAFYLLENLPLTSNLKIDRKSLPLPEKVKSLVRTTYTPPRDDIEKKLVLLWENVLKISPIGIHDNFFSLGGTSLLVTKIILGIQELFQTEIALHQFFALPTIAQVSKLLKNQSVSSPVLTENIYLRQDIAHYRFTLPKVNHSIKMENIFLTGATGFVGGFLLKTLLQHYEAASIYCLIRATNVKEAEEKLQQGFLRSGITLNNADFKRIQYVIGDLNQPLLGLPHADFLTLANTIDCIFHNAASVHHIFDYEQLRQTNVEGTKQILELASIQKAIPIHYISTLAAGEKNQKGHIKEQFPSELPENFMYGYTLSKWVAEHLLAHAKVAGLPVTIYRAPWVAGEYTHGYGDMQNNQLFLLLKGCLQLGIVPSWNIAVDIIPVDFLCQVIVKSSSLKQSSSVFNLSHPHLTSWQRIISCLKKYDNTLKIVSPKVWQTNYLPYLSPDNAMYTLLPLYLYFEPLFYAQQSPLEIASSVETTHTLKMLKKTGLSYPLITNALLEKYFKLALTHSKEFNHEL